MEATVFIAAPIVAIFVIDAGRRWWRENRRRYHRHDDAADP